MDKNSQLKWNFWTFEWLDENSVNFFFKLCITLQCHGEWVFCIFLGETLYHFYKRSRTIVQNFRLLIAQVKSHQICTLIGYFYRKHIKFQLKKVWRKYVSWYYEWCKIWRKTYCFKNDKNLVNVDLCTKKSKTFSLWLVPFVQNMQRLT